MEEKYEKMFFLLQKEDNDTLVKACDHFNAQNGMRLSRQKFMIKLVNDYFKTNCNGN